MTLQKKKVAFCLYSKRLMSIKARIHFQNKPNHTKDILSAISYIWSQKIKKTSFQYSCWSPPQIFELINMESNIYVNLNR